MENIIGWLLAGGLLYLVMTTFIGLLQIMWLEFQLKEHRQPKWVVYVYHPMSVFAKIPVFSARSVHAFKITAWLAAKELEWCGIKCIIDKPIRRIK